MKKNIYISVIAALFAGFTLTACSDFLEAENKTAGGQTADDFFGKDASALLTAAYSSLKNYAFSTDLYSRGTDLYIHTRGKSVSDFDTYTFNTENSTISSLYSNVYRTINLSNGVISYAGADSQLGQEARFLRNYGYYILTQHFGGVPYITEYINSAEKNFPRTPLNEVYSAVIEDLTNLYNSSSLEAQSHTGKASKQAVAALLAKVYLAAGWDLDTSLGDALQGSYNVSGTSNFSQAASWAEKAINGVSLTMSFEDKWSPFNEGNAEEIFSVQYDRASYPGDIINGGHSMHGAFGGYYGAYDASGIKGVSSDDCQSQKSMYLFEKGDERYAATYMMVMYNATKDASNKPAWGNEGYYAYYNCSDAELSKMAICKVYFPYYYTEAEVQAWIDAHESQLIADKDKYANADVRVSLLTLPQVTNWVYVQDRTVKMGRFQIYNNWSPYLVKDLEHTVWMGLEYFCNEGDSMWNMKDDDFAKLGISEMIKLGLIDSDKNVLDYHVERVKKAYPAYFDTYSEMDTLRKWLDTVPNLFCVGRNGQHRYNNIDHSMCTSFEAVKDILSGSTDRSNVWNVNTEQEYHEEEDTEKKQENTAEVD